MQQTYQSDVHFCINDCVTLLTMKTSTKMYLSVVLSTICIMFYQYQLSKASLLTMQNGNSANGNGNSNSIENEVVILANANRTFKIGPKDKQTTANTDASPSMQTISVPNNNEAISLVQAHHSGRTAQQTSDSSQKTMTMSDASDKYPVTDLTNDSQPATTQTPVPPPPPLYIITPTFRRPEQLAEITRLGYTLKHVPNVFWLVIEDAVHHTPLLTRQLKRIGVPFEHLVAPMPHKYKKRVAKPRGVSNRNRGLAWIRKNATDGVFYFADDDNTYDLEIFHQMRFTKKVSMWPVGLVTKFGVSSPIVRNGTLSGFYDGWIGGRKYPVDMAGFAVNVKFFLSRPKAIMPYDAGYEEDKFLKSLAPLHNSEIELLASNCTEILTWHTQTKKNPIAAPLDMNKYNGTNLVSLRKILV